MDEFQVKSSLVKDAVEAQRSRGEEPTPGAVDSYMADVLQKLSRKSSEKKQRPHTNKKLGAVEREFEKRGGSSADKWSIDRDPKPLSPFQLKRNAVEKKLRKRLKWIRKNHPGLRKELETLSLAAYSKDGARRARAEQRIRQILARSNAMAGREWWKPEPLKSWSNKCQ